MRFRLQRPILLAALALAAPFAAGGAEVREEILVIVNNHVITRKSLQQAVEQEHASLYRQYSGKELDAKLRDARDKTLQGLIDAFLIEDKAEDLGIKQNVNDEYIRGIIEDIKKQYSFATDADFERALQTSQGIGLEEFKKFQKRQILNQAVMSREVFQKVAVEDQELLAYYQDHRDEYRQPSRFRIRELVVAKGAGPAERAAARTVLAQIQEALKKGTSFEDLVREHSTSPSKATGGDLGWIGKGLLRPAIENAALGLKPGEVSGPIETDKDTYIIQLVSAELDLVKPFSEVRPQILEKLREPKAENAIQNYLQNLRLRSNIRFNVPKEQILKGS
ncbi:MAG: peptidyl-prolyl cis-trans isomerase [Acidobacteria bacterium]|nr:peptidyl-prolyl cis-trans isomerase [Acidobacteriota bacterium]